MFCRTFFTEPSANLELLSAPATGEFGKFAAAETHRKQYAAIRDAHYVPVLYNRIGYVDVTALTKQVAADLDIARNWKLGLLKDDGKRENLSIKLSRDDGKTWPVSKTLEAGSSAYSDLAVMPDGIVLCLYEGKKDIQVARFNLEWITSP